MDFTVAGIEYENRKELIKKNILEGFSLQAVAENNPYDTNAIALYHGKLKLGYVPRELNSSEPFRSQILSSNTLVIEDIREETKGRWIVSVRDYEFESASFSTKKWAVISESSPKMQIRINRSDFERNQKRFNEIRKNGRTYSEDYQELLSVLVPFSEVTISTIDENEYLLTHKIGSYQNCEDWDDYEYFCMSSLSTENLFSNSLSNESYSKKFIIKSVRKENSDCLELTLSTPEKEMPFTDFEIKTIKNLIEEYEKINHNYSLKMFKENPRDYSKVPYFNPYYDFIKKINFNFFSAGQGYLSRDLPSSDNGRVTNTLSKTDEYYYLTNRFEYSSGYGYNDVQKLYEMLEKLANYLSNHTNFNFEVGIRDCDVSLSTLNKSRPAPHPILYLHQKYSHQEGLKNMIQDLFLSRRLVDQLSSYLIVAINQCMHNDDENLDISDIIESMNLHIEEHYQSMLDFDESYDSYYDPSEDQYDRQIHPENYDEDGDLNWWDYC